MLFTKNGCNVFDKNECIIATGSIVNNMFRLDVVKNERAYSVKVNSETFDLWHRRLGHASVSKLNLILNSGINPSNFKCVTCAEGKQTRIPFSASETRSGNLLDLIHSDVCGPITPRSIVRDILSHL